MTVIDGLVTQECTGTVRDVLERLRRQLVERRITLFAVIDHAQGARDAGLQLNDEVVVLFGNPIVGTSLMQENPLVGIDLPLRILLWDERGVTTAAFISPEELAHRFSLDQSTLPMKPLSTLLTELAESISA